MLRVCAGELAAIAGKAGADEVARAKAQLRASLLMGRESVAGCADALARQVNLFGKPSDDNELLAAIDAVDEAAVSAVAARIIASGGPVMSAVGPAGPIMSNDMLGAALSA